MGSLLVGAGLAFRRLSDGQFILYRIGHDHDEINGANVSIYLP